MASSDIGRSKKRLTHQQQHAMVRCLEAELAVGKKRDLVVHELAKFYGVDQRTIERYISSVGREAQRRVAKMREEHSRGLAWIAGILRGNAVKLKASPEMPVGDVGGISMDYSIVGSIMIRTYYVGIFDPLAAFEPSKQWYVDARAAMCLLAHLNQESPEIKVDDWWAVKKENITPELMDALQGLAERQSFSPATSCPECRAIEEAGQA